MCAKGESPLEPPRPTDPGNGIQAVAQSPRRVGKDREMARPSKAKGGLTKPFSFRLSEAEAMVLDGKIEQSGMSRAEFLRECVLTNRTTVIARPQASLEKKRMQFLFNKTSNNLNQIAHGLNSAHQSGRLSDSVFKDALSNLGSVARYLKAALNHVD